MSSASRAVKKNSSIGLKAAKPVMATVFATRPNTPIGANRITHMVISVMMSITPCQKWVSVLACSDLLRARKKPNNKLKKISPNISPLAAASTTLVGTMRTKTCTISLAPRPSTLDKVSLSSGSLLLMVAAKAWLSPLPGAITLTTARPIKMAIRLLDA